MGVLNGLIINSNPSVHKRTAVPCSARYCCSLHSCEVCCSWICMYVCVYIYIIITYALEEGHLFKCLVYFCKMLQ